MSSKGIADMRSPVGVNIVAACLACCFLVASGCGDSSSKRNYTKAVEFQGQPAVKIECEYVGKRPGDPDAFVSDHDYQKIDTDFYRLTMENLTDNDIVIERVEYQLEKGPVRGRQSASAESIQQTWGTNVIPAKAEISCANSMVWAKAKRNTLIKTYFFRIATDDDADKTFTAEVPLVYIR